MPAVSSAPTPQTHRLRPLLAWALGLAVLGWFYAWAPAAFRQPWLTASPTGYYHELTAGFLSGHLSLPRVPDPRLVALPDPYDPKANAPYRINDLSYFQGHYYLYHSAVPAVVLFVPVRVLTGQYLSETAASFIFVLAGTGAMLGLLASVRRTLFPASPPFLLAASLGMLAVGQGYQVVLRDGMLNQVPIASAYCFFSLMLLALWHAGLTGPVRLRWLGLASLAGGLAVASRPNYLFCLPVLVLPLALRWRTDGFRLTGRTAREWLVALIPVALLLAAQLAYNQARFGQLLEFGPRYMLGNWDQRQLAALGFGNIAANAHYYLFSTAAYHATFPFVTAPSWQAVGLLWHVPFVWLLALLPFAWGRDARLHTLALLAGWAAGANLFVLLLLPSGNPEAVLTSANARYVLDFLPALVFLAALAALAASDAWSRRPVARRTLVATAGLLAVISAVAGLSLDFQRYPPEAYRSFARIVNRPVWWWQGLRGAAYGPVELKLQLPTDRIGAYEPLVATGTGEGGELLHVFYEAPGTIRLGLVDSLAVGPQSGPIVVDYAQPHRFSIQLGSLYPADGHPAWGDLSDAQIALLRRRLVVRIDDRVVFEAPAYFRPNESGRVLIGHTDFLLAYAQGKFSGRLLSVTRGPLIPSAGLEEPKPAYGALRLQLAFPAGRAGITEPLVTTGIPQAGDVLHVTYRADGAVRFGFDHWGRPGLASDWIEHALDGQHSLELKSGALYPPEGHALLATLPVDQRRNLKDRVQLVFDGRVVLEGTLTAYGSSPYDVVVGRNSIGASTAVYAFTGKMLEVERVAWPSARR